jgi:hypothetical protein
MSFNAPLFEPNSLPHLIHEYLDDKMIEHRIYPNNMLVMHRKKRMELHLYQVPAKLLRQVLLPEFTRLALRWGTAPRPSFTFRRRGIIKKIKVRF